MRRAYIESSEPLPTALAAALKWAGNTATIHAPTTATIEENRLEDLRVPITCASRRSRFEARPAGTVIGVFLNPAEILDVERGPEVEGVVALGAHGPIRHLESVPSHAPWVTAHSPEHLGGEIIDPVPAVPAALRAAIRDLTSVAVLNQGLIDKRERSEVIHALTYLRNQGFRLDPDALMVEALRNQWCGSGALELHRIAVDINGGSRLRFDSGRLRLERLQEWTALGE